MHESCYSAPYRGMFVAPEQSNARDAPSWVGTRRGNGGVALEVEEHFIVPARRSNPAHRFKRAALPGAAVGAWRVYSWDLLARCFSRQTQHMATPEGVWSATWCGHGGRARGPAGQQNCTGRRKMTGHFLFSSEAYQYVCLTPRCLASSSSSAWGAPPILAPPRPASIEL